MRILRLVVPALVASAVVASAASAASTQQAAQDRFAQDAQGVRIVSAPATAAASTVTGTVSAKRLGVASDASAGHGGPRRRQPLRGAARRGQRQLPAALRAGDDRRPRPAPRALRPARRRRAGLRRRRHRAPRARRRADRLHRRRLARDQRRGDAGVGQRRPGARRGLRPGRRRQARAGAEALRLHRRAVRQPPGHAGLGGRRHLDHACPSASSCSSTPSPARSPTRSTAPSSPRTGRSTTPTAARRPARFARGEGDPATGNRDVDNAYDFTGATYDYYASNFGRDSYDGAGRGARELRALRRRLPERVLGRLRDGLRRRLRGQRRHRARAHPRGDRAHGGPRVPGPARCAERVDLRPGRLGRRPRRLDHGRGPAHRRDPRHAQPGRLRAAGHRVAVRLHLERQRRRAHQQRDPEQGLRQPGRLARPRRRGAGPLPRADRLHRARPRRSPTRGRPSSRRPPTSASAPTTVGNAWQAQGVTASWQPPC